LRVMEIEVAVDEASKEDPGGRSRDDIPIEML
jgi:hypothetical protein